MADFQTDSKCDLILCAAASLFERYGYSKTTIEDIAAAANIGKGTVYLHFSSKEEIGLAWLCRVHEQLMLDLHDVSQPLLDAGKPIEAIREWLLQRVLLRHTIYESYRQSLDEALPAFKAQVEERKKAFQAREADTISTFIYVAINRGLATSSDPASDAASMILATNSLLPFSLRSQTMPDRATVTTRANLLIDLLLRSITCQPK